MSETSKSDVRELISFKVGDQEYCVDIMAVREIRGWTPATPLPNAPPFVCGVINLRGTVLPVVDMAARLNLPQRDPMARSVIIVVWIDSQLVGLLVDAVCDILTVPRQAMQATPDLATADVQTFVEALLTVEDRMIGVIRLDHILPPLQSHAA